MPTHLGEQLNEAQYEAVTHEGTPLIVLAGPGSGKTHVIVHRIAHLVRERGVQPESIVALTFTNKAAEEMRRRIAAMLESSAQAERIIASTFHSFGLRLIRQFADLAGWRSEPTLIDEAQQRALMRSIIDETRLGVRRHPYRPEDLISETLRFINECRNGAILPERASAFADEWESKHLEASNSLSDDERIAESTRIEIFREHVLLYQRFEGSCREQGWVTFDDLQTQALQLLRTDERIRAITRTDHQHIVVDEFQDVNAAQIELLRELAGPNHDLCVVGDDDQAIYGFRGSIPHSFSRVVETWPDTCTIELTKNYRSSRIIVSAADRVIHRVSDRFRPDKTLEAAGDNAGADFPIEAFTYTGTSGAGAVIGEQILSEVSAKRIRWKDVAVIVRTNIDLERVAAALEAMDIPVETPETGANLSHPVVTDVLAWLRILSDPYEESQLLRILIRPPFLLPLDQLANWHREYTDLKKDAQRRLAEMREQENRADGTEDGGTNDPDTSSNPADPSVKESTVEQLRQVCYGTFIDQFIEWNRHSAVARFASVYQELSKLALTAPADDLVLHIIHSIGVLTIDPVDSIEHRARVEQLGMFLAFVRERMPMLDQPRRVDEFMRYYDDLLAGGGIASPGLSAEDRMEQGIEFSDRDAVRVLTAHRAKGLEFDMVFLPRLNTRGYPQANYDRGPDLMPEGLRADDPPDTSDEERRVFFVALTRARKRLVLLAQTRSDSGRRSTPSLYWKELIEDQGHGLPVILHHQDEEGEDGDGTKPEVEIEVDSTLLGSQTNGRSDATINSAVRQRERLILRRRIYATLHDLTLAAQRPERLVEIQSELHDLGLQLAMLSARSEDEIQNLLRELPDKAKRNELGAYFETIAQRDPWYELLPAPKPPLEISFSDIEQYLRCPRCYWLRHIVGLREKQTGVANFGSIIHRTLEFFYRDWIRHRTHPKMTTEPVLDDLLRHGRDAYENLRSAEYPWSQDMAERIDSALRVFFERLHSSDVHPLETETSTVFDFPLGEHVHRIKARIDRIDLAGENTYRVIDYKTGFASKSKLNPERKDLQLGTYYLALCHRMERDDLKGGAEYWLTRSGERGMLPFDKINVSKVREQIAAAIEGILGGRWEKEENCRSCDLLSDAWTPDREAGTATPDSQPNVNA